jgi:hypothetical protein
VGDKDTASVARHVDNKLRPLPPQEYIVIVGGCTNTFNGWHSFMNDATDTDSIWNPMPSPQNQYEMQFMFKTPQAVDINTIDKSKWTEYGWSEYGVGELKGKGWNGKTVHPQHPESHDLYWGNFIDPATRLYFQTGSLSNPHQRPEPKKGDIVTFFIYYTAYRKRNRLDWRASPYNFYNRNKYVDPKLNPTAAAWWGRPTTPSTNKVTIPGPPITRTVHDIENEKKRKEADQKAREADKVKKLEEDDVNFYILMSTTSENTDHAIKRPKNDNHYFEYMRGDWGDGPLGSVYKFGALCKVFFFTDINQIVDYVQRGKWVGKEWDGGPDTADDGTSKNYVFMPGRPVYRDIYNRPLKVTTPWYKHWDKTPNVDRDLIKIRRFDYFGHSDASNMILEYGWSNEKGEPPDYDYTMVFDDLRIIFKGKVLTHDATAELWGCNLGANNDDGTPGIAPQLAELLFPGGVVAADVRTIFDHVLDNESNMPEPAEGYVLNADKTAYVKAPGKWTFYPHKMGTK